MISNIMNICISGDNKKVVKNGSQEAMTLIEKRIAKRKAKMVKEGMIDEEPIDKGESDILWLATILMKGDTNQPYQSILDMTLTEVFGVFEKSKIMQEKREKNKKGKKKSSGKSVDITSLNIPKLGSKRGEK